jgi:hypothetical protein
LIFIAEAVSFLMLQMLWGGDFLCRETPQQHSKVNTKNLTFLILLLLTHFGYISTSFFASISERDGATWKRGRLARLWSLIEKDHFSLWYCLILIFSIVALEEHVRWCNAGIPDDRFDAATVATAPKIAIRATQALRHAQLWHLLVHAVRLLNALLRSLWLEKHLRTGLQTLVSTNKRRFRDEEFDLDLTYICDRLIGMAVPCVHGTMYRNDIKDVARFFATRHYGAFVVVNLAESFEENRNGNYDPRLLYGQVQRIQCVDHGSPSLKVLVEFCGKARSWLNASRNNVIAIHCRGGKGRTGTFCCALLYHSHTKSAGRLHSP